MSDPPAVTTEVADVLQKVNAERVIQLAMDLTNIESPTGKEGTVGQFYADQLKALGMRVTLQEVEPARYNVLGVLRGKRPEATTLMFNGHLDTSFAPSDDPEILKAISPAYRFSPPWCRREADWLYGLGVFNMKSALAAYVGAVAAVQNGGVELPGDVVIAGVVGEIEKTQVERFRGPEYRGYGYGTAYLVSHGGTADAAILGEPTGLRLMRAHFGSVWARIGLKGALVHTAHSAGLGNVIQQMVRVVLALEQWIPDYQRRFTYAGVKPTVNIGSFEGGWPWRASRTPGFANVYVDVRFPPGRHPLDVEEELRRVLAHVAAQHGIHAELELYVTDAWAEVSEDAYIVDAVSRAHSRVFAKPCEQVVFAWSSDANVLTRHGIDAINYGPAGGSGRETRGTQYIPALIDCTRVYAAAVLDICSRSRAEVRRRRTAS